MVAHLYDEVAGCISAWDQAGIDVRIYSSGSIQAQKLFFGHTLAGDLLDKLNGHYDTTTGPKQELTSYQKIAADFNCLPSAILFVSDVVAELDAAKAAGLQTLLSFRPGNKRLRMITVSQSSKALARSRLKTVEITSCERLHPRYL